MSISIAISAGFSLVFYLTGFFVFLTPFPIAYQAVRRGILPALASFLLVLLALVLLYCQTPESVLNFLPMATLRPHFSVLQVSALGLLCFFFYGWTGLSVGLVSRRPLSLEKSFCLLVLVTLSVPGLLLMTLSKGLGVHLIPELRGALQYIFDHMIEMQEKASSIKNVKDGTELVFLKEYAPVIVLQLMSVLPALLINLTTLILSLNILFLRRWCPAESPFPGWKDFSSWRLDERLIWLPIAAAAAYLADFYLIHGPLLETLALNVLLVLALAYFFQGLAIIIHVTRSRLPPLIRMFAYLMIFLFFQVIGIFIIALGLFDFWFDFRKLKRVA